MHFGPRLLFPQLFLTMMTSWVMSYLLCLLMLVELDLTGRELENITPTMLSQVTSLMDESLDISPVPAKKKNKATIQK